MFSDEIMQLDSSPLRAADITPDLRKRFAFLSGDPVVFFISFVSVLKIYHVLASLKFTISVDNMTFFLYCMLFPLVIFDFCLAQAYILESLFPKPKRLIHLKHNGTFQ